MWNLSKTMVASGKDKGWLEADGHGLQQALLVPLGMDRRRAALGTAVACTGLFDAKRHAALEKVGSAILVATNDEGVIE